MRTAVVTASYAADFERCQMLCDSMDQHLHGLWHHYILVQTTDFKKFRTLSDKHRTIVDEADLFPFWFRAVPDPISKRHNRIWLSPFSRPLRGWHVQQLRRLAIAEHLSEPIMLSIDSDVILVRDFDVDRLQDNGKVRFYKKPSGLMKKVHVPSSMMADQQMEENRSWSHCAGQLLGLRADQNHYHDYIQTFIAWRTQTVRDLLNHIAKVHGQSWFKQLIKQRAFSECLIYGRYVDDILNGQDHTQTDEPLCQVMWFEEENSDQIGKTSVLNKFLAGLAPGQVAIGIQSFINLELDDIRAQVKTHNFIAEPERPAD